MGWSVRMLRIRHSYLFHPAGNFVVMGVSNGHGHGMYPRRPTNK